MSAWNVEQRLAAEYVAAVELEETRAERLEDAVHRGDDLETRIAAYWHGLAAMERARVGREYLRACTGRKGPQMARGAHA